MESKCPIKKERVETEKWGVDSSNQNSQITLPDLTNLGSEERESPTPFIQPFDNSEKMKSGI